MAKRGKSRQRGTLFRAPNGELYYILDASPQTVRRLKPADKANEVKRIFNRFFRDEVPWLPAVYGAFFYGPRPMPGPCCAALKEALEEALEEWQMNKKK